LKRLLFGFVIGIALSPYMRSTQAQSSITISGTVSPGVATLGQERCVTATGDCTVIVEPGNVLKAQYHDAEMSTVPHGEHDLTVRDLVEILADYEIKHVEQQPFFQPAYGVTNFDSNPPAVWIFNTSDTPSRRSTVIHELLHVYYHQRGTDLTEEFIRSEEDRQYKALFGVTQ
jgi:hypothetical protein